MKYFLLIAALAIAGCANIQQKDVGEGIAAAVRMIDCYGQYSTQKIFIVPE